MSFQYGMTNRRQFLERSMLGFGGAFLLPSLLASCTDHGIPGPDPNPNLPITPLRDSNFDWNDAAKAAVTTGLEMVTEEVPGLGTLLGGLVDVFWPNDKPSPWEEVKAEVEALVNQKLDGLVYTQVTAYLTGLNNQIVLYKNALRTGTSIEKLTEWQTTRSLFEFTLPQFQLSGYEVLLLPLFAQLGNMYLAVLRDGSLHGLSWGRTDGDQQQTATDLTTKILDLSSYAVSTYTTGLTKVQQNTPTDNHLCEPFRSLNRYERQTTLTVFDYMWLWQYYDVTKYPKGAQVTLNREIYSDPMGTCDDSGPINLPPPPTQFPTQLSVWNGDYINSIQLTYPQGGGPGGVTTTPRMGASASGGTNRSFNITGDNLIVGVEVTWGSVVNTLQFYNPKIATTPQLGNLRALTNTSWYGYEWETLSSIHINGVSDFYKTADCVVLGFKYYQSPAGTVKAIQAIYVTNPKELSAADFAKAFPKLAIPANFITSELKAARQAHWAYVEARAKELK